VGVVPEFRGTCPHAVPLPQAARGVLGKLSEPRQLFVIIAAMTSGRLSEVKALQWKDVPLDDGWVKLQDPDRACSAAHQDAMPGAEEAALRRGRGVLA
jgi:hypothetical protein